MTYRRACLELLEGGKLVVVVNTHTWDGLICHDKSEANQAE